MVITRFNPTLNGPAHLGHATTLLVNEYFAHSVGGQFYVRFDDTSYTANRSGDRMYRIMDQWQEDIEWLGVEVDKWCKQSEFLEYSQSYLKNRDFPLVEEDEAGGYLLPNYVRLGNTLVMYPFCPRQTAERVVMDHVLDITHIIRGEDFLTEVSYYYFCCQFLGFPFPEFICLPRLVSRFGDISKTNGGFTIAEYRANGYLAQDVLEILEKSCLINPKNSWNISNLKPNPVLII